MTMLTESSETFPFFPFVQADKLAGGEKFPLNSILII